MFQMAHLLMMENKSANSFCRSYGLDKNLTFKYELDLDPTWTNVLYGTPKHDGKQYCQIILKSIQNCRSYGRDKFGRTHTRTLYCHWDKYVSLIASGLDKNLENQVKNILKNGW